MQPVKVLLTGLLFLVLSMGPLCGWWPARGPIDEPADEEPVPADGSDTDVTPTDEDPAGGGGEEEPPAPLPLALTATAEPSSLLSGGTAILQADAAGGVPPYTYAWSPRQGLTRPDAADPRAGPVSTTTYRVMVTDAAGASTTASVPVSVTPLYRLRVEGSGQFRLDGRSLHTAGTGEFSGLYPSGTELTLEAIPEFHSRAIEWEGDWTGRDPVLQVVMDCDKSVRCHFFHNPLWPPGLMWAVEGEGTILFEPADHVVGDQVKVTAVAAPGWRFARWGGTLSGTINPNAAYSQWDCEVLAWFEPESP